MAPLLVPERKMHDPLDELRKRYISRIPHSFEYAGYTWAGTVNSLEKINSLKEMEFGPNDVVIASSPKSGTTWASEVLSAIAHEGNIDLLNSTKIFDRVPWIELDYGALSAKSPDMRSSRKQAITVAKRRIFSTHLPIELLPPSVREGKCKLLYVARNPKDHAVSYYHFHKMAKFLGLQTEMTWNEFFSLFCSGDLWYGSWFDHVLSYWEFTRNNPMAKFICYEDMQRNIMKQMKMLEQFVGVSLTMEQRVKVVEHCSFDSMKSNKMTNRDGNLLLDESITKFMRKGIVGDWKNYFTIAQSEEFDEMFKRKVEGSGLKFVFE